MYQNIYIYSYEIICFSLPPYGVGQLTESHMKKCSEFQNNAVGCMSFAGWASCRLGIPYMHN